MADKSNKRWDEIDYRDTHDPKKIITVQNDPVGGLPTEEKLKLLREIEDMGDWRGLYEDMYVAFSEDEDVQIRRMAVGSFWDFPKEEHIDRLIGVATEDSDEEVRAAACSSLGRYVYEGFATEDLSPKDFHRVRQFLLKVVKSEKQTPAVRRRALESLGYDSSEDVAKLIEEAYQQDSVNWKASAVLAMGRSHQERWHEIIVKEMDSEHRRMRIEAVSAAQEGYVSSAGAKLCELTKSPDREIRLLAINALPFTRGEGAIPALEKCTMDLDLDVVEAAEKALDDFFGLEDEEPSEMDKVDVRLGTISDIPILDSSRPQPELVAAISEAAAAEAAEAAAGEEAEAEEPEEEPEEEPQGEVPPEIAAEAGDQPEEVEEEGEEEGEEGKEEAQK